MRLLSIALSAAIAASVLVMPSTANADQLAATLCEYVAANDKSRLRKQLKSNKIKLRNIYDGVICSGNNLLRFSMIKNADKVGKFIVKKLPAKQLKASGDFEWAGANGHGGSAVAAAIKERAGL